MVQAVGQGMCKGNDMRSALHLFRHALDLEPQSSAAQRHWSVLHASSSTSSDLACFVLQQRVDAEPKCYALRTVLAEACCRIKSAHRALHWSEQALALVELANPSREVYGISRETWKHRALCCQYVSI